MSQTEETVDAFDERPSRFVIGVDLGTTNCAVAYIDTEQPSGIQLLKVGQWVDFGSWEQLELLPSFRYQTLKDESPLVKDAEFIVGSLARDRGLQMPGRQIASAKSWLCHDGVDREAPILPWQSDEGVEKISPVEASASYLQQIGEAWDKRFPEFPIEDQEVILTLPASFDQVARQLTMEAAERAGFRHVVPIEEPQAAFYAWLEKHQAEWEDLVEAGQTILVCDIGGGTTDFTLIRIRDAGHDRADGVKETLEAGAVQRLSLHRVAVGQHLILGGDNLDLSLAKLAEGKLGAKSPLSPRAWDALRQACRTAKEILLGADPPDSFTINLPGSGSRLVGGGRQIEVTRDEVQQAILEGFFPHGDLSERPLQQQTGFQEFGLPFATDPAITKHLSAFLWDHRFDGRTDSEKDSLSDLEAARPDWILFNGGVMASSQLSQRIVDSIQSWFAGTGDQWQPGVLDSTGLDRAVAMGAAYFGNVRRGHGVAIEAKLACAYYLQTELDPPQAVCIVPGDASPGQQFALKDLPFELTVGQPVQFRLAYSGVRLADALGHSVELTDEQFRFLPPIRTVLQAAGSRKQLTLPVFMEVELTQIGTLELFCRAIDGDHRWKLEFDVRGSTQSGLVPNSIGAHAADQPATELVDETTISAATDVLESVFAESAELKPNRAVHKLAEVIGAGKSQWRPNLLRAIWSELIRLNDGRKLSPAHEARWLNLAGYALRPGYGCAADDWRVSQTWRAVHGQLAFGAASSRNESLILWRRIAGGFTAGQQLTVYQQIAGPLRGLLDPVRRAKGGAGATTPQELVELLRLVGSLELLPKSEKRTLGTWLLDLMDVRKWQPCQGAILWTLGRLGARVPVYGPLNCVVDVNVVEQWLERLLSSRPSDPNLPFALMLCARRVGDRYRDINADLREEVVAVLKAMEAPEHYQQLVADGGELDSDDAEQVMGESLPLGLTFGGAADGSLAK